MAGPPSDLAGRTATVMGVGRFGGGVGVVRWLCGQGASVRLTDIADASRLADSLAALRPMIDSGQVRLRLGGHDIEDFTTTDLVVASPAVPHPWDNLYLRAATEAGVPITTEIRLLVERLDRDQTIGVTGSAGKSTTSAMIAHILRRHGCPAHWGGNIGGSLLDQLPRIRREDPVVLELSSFMLHWLGAGVGWPSAPAWSPSTALLTNLFPNHLDWHGQWSDYVAAKENIFGGHDGIKPRHAFRGDQLPGEIVELQLPDDLLRTPGSHNRQNARMALAVAGAWLDRPAGELVDALRSFPGLPHRLEFVVECDGLRFINDSKSTTPQSTLQAISALCGPMRRDRIHLIAGGYDKGSDLSEIAALAPDLAGLYTIGATATALAKHRNAEVAGTIEAALRLAVSRGRPGDCVLLSPGCASWDQFDNYEERGETFRRLVVALTDSSPANDRSGAGDPGPDDRTARRTAHTNQSAP